MSLGRSRDCQQQVQPGGRLVRQLLLHREHIDAVIVHRMQRRGSGRGNPCGVRARFGMADFLHHHIGHPIGCGPHAFADLRFAR